ncbi:hypothetical protein ACFX2I_024770 [Malus domestica]|uniref:uncharacterized protein At1g51745-like n=1 Tax=Malus domestica TaxID=3750 RepID=UPI0021AD15DB|nr:uncharacterized protein At1g51745-like [Malus sylvestris]XP_050137079.1 uncharacterized protein At1g51745-like [Malus sylvestris]
MGSSGETSEKSIDASVGSLVWVRRRNGSWWPGRIMGLDELPDSCVVSPKSGTPVKLLGRDDASVDWYNLERSKRVKAFRCGEYDECIEKAKAHAASGNKKKVKYARREDAIIHALEIENARLGNDDLNFSARMGNSGGDHGCSARELPAMSHSSEENEDMVDDVSDSEDNPDSGPELSQSGISFEEPNHISSSKLQTLQGRRRRTPNDSEDDGTEGVKRMRGLEDLGMGVLSKRSVQTGGLLEQVQQDGASLLDSNARNGMPNGSPVNGSKGTSSLKRKRSQVANVNELSKRKNRSRPLTKVLESTAMVSIPAMPDQLPSSCDSPLQGLSNCRVSGLESNESKGSLSADHTGISCENGNAPELASGTSFINDKLKDSEIPSISGIAENDSSDDKLFDVPFVGEEKDPSGSSPILTACSSGKPQNGAMGRQSSQSRQAESVTLKNERINESGCTSSAALHDIGISIDKGSSKWQLKGKRNSRQTSKDRTHDSRRYMDMDDGSNTYSAGIKHSNGLSPGSYQKVNCNGISGSGAYNGTLRPKSKHVTELPDGPTQRSLPYRQSRFTVPARYQTADSTARNSCSDGSLYDVDLEVKSNYRPQHVPLVSLMSKLNGKAIVGHPLTVEVLGDGSSDWEVGKTGYAIKPKKEIGRIPAKGLAVQQRNSPSRSPKTKKSGLQPKKIRKLSSLTGHKQSEERKPLVPKPKGPVIACIPLKVVFSRINEAVNGLARPSHRVLRSSNA